MRFPKLHFSASSLRLTVLVSCGTVLLLLVSLGALSWFAHQALKDEAMHNAQQMLSGTVQQVDNILVNVEQSTDFVYQDLRNHLSQRDRMFTYCSRIVESSPYITGCAIAFKPYFYPDRELFMTYVHLSSEAGDSLVAETSFGDRPYTEHVWYLEPMGKGCACWTNPLPEEEDEGVTISYCRPIYDSNRQLVGTLAVDVPVELLSDVVLASKPSEHGFSVLLARNGSFIVHPYPEYYTHQSVYALVDSVGGHGIMEAAESMLAGKTGYNYFQMAGDDWCVFYKPFARSEKANTHQEALGWSLGVIYPDDDIFGVHNNLIIIVLVIAIIGLVVFLLVSRWAIRRQLQPLNQLVQSVDNMVGSNFKEIVTDTRRDDEIGDLHMQIQQMQRSVSGRLSELSTQAANLKSRTEVLRKGYHKAQETDNMETSFIHYMTNQMTVPSETLERTVTNLCNNYRDLDETKFTKQVEAIKSKSEAIINLLDETLKVVENIKGKEADNE